ncbi:M56 family metallopeptidase [Ornithinimicrobium cavernae]|uniref:M56 family metallopeptidase n=1 Tax=Ornithinimicrobium cavernae TaxID=2666047 RepID=UPI00192A49DA|nr:M56 family metallopeptidase [Ornithinimicrobium cavernae]
MTPGLLAGLLAVALLAAAVLGPWMLRGAAPALVHAPRLAVGLLFGSVLIWLGTALALGPLLAWVVTGPDVLPAPAAQACQQCLNAANPFLSGGTVDTAVPVVLLLALPALVTAALGTAVTRECWRRQRESRRTADRVLAGATHRRLLGHDVLVLDDERPLALTFPVRHGGIALSTGALRSLDRAELAAVLAHEEAHLRQHHHLVTGLVSSLARHLRWVPLVAAVEAALPDYLEIAADNHARQRAGTPALVSALVRLGERASPVPEGQLAGALHAAGPERIRHLVLPGSGAAGALPVLAVTTHLLVLAVVGAAVHLPYLLAALNGC